MKKLKLHHRIRLHAITAIIKYVNFTYMFKEAKLHGLIWNSSKMTKFCISLPLDYLSIYTF